MRNINKESKKTSSKPSSKHTMKVKLNRIEEKKIILECSDIVEYEISNFYGRRTR